MEKLPEKLGAEYYRGYLSGQGREFYDQLNARLRQQDYSGETVFSLHQPKTAATDCFAAYRALVDDHPEYFFLGFQSEFTHAGRTGTLRYPILYSPANIERVRQQLRRSICRLVRGTGPLPMIEREILVYGRIARKLTFANHRDVRDHNIVGPVLLSCGVCEGQNALLMLCLRRVGIPCIKVYGKTRDGGSHCWTIAWINGSPVHCDVTWDGALEGVVRFNYLNLSDDQIGGDHFAFQGVNIPVCSTGALNYYRYRGLCVGSFRELRERLRADSARGVSPTLLHFSYLPAHGDYPQEIRRAFSEERIAGAHELYANPHLKNYLLRKV